MGGMSFGYNLIQMKKNFDIENMKKDEVKREMKVKKIKINKDKININKNENSNFMKFEWSWTL
tara:strand:- start:825 stop:1013 length:189 start_codon:yes stop_codon:yes gene_type:complete